MLNSCCHRHGTPCMYILITFSLIMHHDHSHTSKTQNWFNDLIRRTVIFMLKCVGILGLTLHTFNKIKHLISFQINQSKLCCSFNSWAIVNYKWSLEVRSFFSNWSSESFLSLWMWLRENFGEYIVCRQKKNPESSSS